MKSFFKKIEIALGTYAVKRIQRWLKGKTVFEIEETGQKLGRLIYKLSKRYRNVTLKNLAMVFPEMNMEERKNLAVKIFEHFGLIGADFLGSERWTKDLINESMDPSGKEQLDEANAEGKGIIAITGHIGNWERLGAWLSYNDYHLNVVARKVRDPELTSFIDTLRGNHGTKTVYAGGAIKPLLRCLRNQEMIGILADQNNRDAFISFMGYPAGTSLSPGVFYERTGAPVVCFWTVRVGAGKYKLFIEKIASSQEKLTAQEVMERAVRSQERVVREYPEQWLWLHPRWKGAIQAGLVKGPLLEDAC